MCKMNAEEWGEILQFEMERWYLGNSYRYSTMETKKRNDINTSKRLISLLPWKQMQKKSSSLIKIGKIDKEIHKLIQYKDGFSNLVKILVYS